MKALKLTAEGDAPYLASPNPEEMDQKTLMEPNDSDIEMGTIFFYSFIILHASNHWDNTQNKSFL